MAVCYDFTDLVLLVGANPLPNYVVAEYIADQVDSLQRIWLLHGAKSDNDAGTGEIAEWLMEVLRRNSLESSNIQIQTIEIGDVGSESSISEATTKLVERMGTSLADNLVINLNYTGGTKAMAVHVYRSLEKYSNTCYNISFSYLDARSHSLRFDKQTEKYYPDTDDLRKQVDICLYDLLNLHGEIRLAYVKNNYKERMDARQREKERDPLNSWWLESKLVAYWGESKAKNILHRYGEMLQSEGLKEFQGYNKWINSNLESYAKTSKNINTNLKEIINFIAADNSSFFYEPWFDRKFLTGTMFEYYVTECISTLIKEKQDKFRMGAMELHTGVEIVKIKDQKSNPYQHELDIIVIHGYQVYVISCSIASKISTVKEKAFEVLHRAQQLGGEEARAVLIAQIEEEPNGNRKVTRDILEESLRSLTEAQPNKFCIIGAQDFSRTKLKERLGNFMWPKGGKC